MNVIIAIHNLIALSLRSFKNLHDDILFMRVDDFIQKYNFYLEGVMEEVECCMSDAYLVTDAYCQEWDKHLERHEGDISVTGMADHWNQLYINLTPDADNWLRAICIASVMP